MQIYTILCRLECPFGTNAGTGEEALSGAEVVGQFDFAAEVEIVHAYMPADIVPDLRLGEEYGLCAFAFGEIAVACAFVVEIRVDSMPLPPEISEAAETKPLDAEQVLHSPDCGQLEGEFAAVFLA